DALYRACCLSKVEIGDNELRMRAGNTATDGRTRRCADRGGECEPAAVAAGAGGAVALAIDRGAVGDRGRDLGGHPAAPVDPIPTAQRLVTHDRMGSERGVAHAERADHPMLDAALDAVVAVFQ